MAYVNKIKPATYKSDGTTKQFTFHFPHQKQEDVLVEFWDEGASRWIKQSRQAGFGYRFIGNNTIEFGEAPPKTTAAAGDIRISRHTNRFVKRGLIENTRNECGATVINENCTDPEDEPVVPPVLPCTECGDDDPTYGELIQPMGQLVPGMKLFFEHPCKQEMRYSEGNYDNPGRRYWDTGEGRVYVWREHPTTYARTLITTIDYFNNYHFGGSSLWGDTMDTSRNRIKDGRWTAEDAWAVDPRTYIGPGGDEAYNVWEPKVGAEYEITEEDIGYRIRFTFRCIGCGGSGRGLCAEKNGQVSTEAYQKGYRDHTVTAQMQGSSNVTTGDAVIDALPKKRLIPIGYGYGNVRINVKPGTAGDRFKFTGGVSWDTDYITDSTGNGVTKTLAKVSKDPWVFAEVESAHSTANPSWEYTIDWTSDMDPTQYKYARWVGFTEEFRTGYKTYKPPVPQYMNWEDPPRWQTQEEADEHAKLINTYGHPNAEVDTEVEDVYVKSPTITSSWYEIPEGGYLHMTGMTDCTNLQHIAQLGQAYTSGDSALRVQSNRVEPLPWRSKVWCRVWDQYDQWHDKWMLNIIDEMKGGYKTERDGILKLGGLAISGNATPSDVSDGTAEVTMTLTNNVTHGSHYIIEGHWEFSNDESAEKTVSAKWEGVGYLGYARAAERSVSFPSYTRHMDDWSEDYLYAHRRESSWSSNYGWTKTYDWFGPFDSPEWYRTRYTDMDYKPTYEVYY